MGLSLLIGVRNADLVLKCSRRYLSAATAVCAIVLTSVVGVGPAGAQSDTPQTQSDLALELQRLRRDLSDIQRFVYRGGGKAPAPGVTSGGGTTPPDAEVSGRLQRQILELQSQLRELTGHVERLQHDVRTANDRLDKLVADVDLRLRALEDGGTSQSRTETPAAQTGQAAPARVSNEGGTTVISSAGETGRPDGLAPGQRLFGRISENDLRNADAGKPAPSGAASGAAPAAPSTTTAQPVPPPAARPAPAPKGASSAVASVAPSADAGGLPEGSIQEQYDFAFGKLKVRDFDGAENAFRTFIDRHPDDPLAGNAMYWMGETYYVRKQFPEAARIFLDAYQRFPKGNKAPDNLYKLAKSLVEIGEKTSACTTFAELMKTFPDANARILSKAQEDMKSLNCT